jgi:drug/metabolite transporter (DMT)-like permease
MQVLLARLDPLDVVSLRTALAALGFAALLLLTRQPLPRYGPAEWRLALLLGFLGVAVFNVATAVGQSRLPASLSSLIVSSSPIFTALVAARLGVERPSRRTVAALALATAGLVLLVFRGRGDDAPLTTTVWLAAAVLAVAPAAWGAYTVLNKPLLGRYPAVPVAATGMILGALMLSPLALIDPARFGRILALDGAGWAAAAFSSLVSLVLGFLLFSWGLRAVSPNEAAIATYLTPVFAVGIAWAALGERPTPGLLLGGALVLAAVLVASRRAPGAPAALVPEIATGDAELLAQPAPDPAPTSRR